MSRELLAVTAILSIGLVAYSVHDTSEREEAYFLHLGPEKHADALPARLTQADVAELVAPDAELLGCEYGFWPAAGPDATRGLFLRIRIPQVLSDAEVCRRLSKRPGVLGADRWGDW